MSHPFVRVSWFCAQLSLLSWPPSVRANGGNRHSITSSVSTFTPTFYRAATWAYNGPSLLVLADGSSIASSKGVRQGDPLGPLLFSLSLRPTLEELARRLPGATLVAYLDNLYILSKDQGALDIAGEVLEKSPYQLNLAKSKEIAIKDLRDQGLKALGTFIGPLQERRSFLEEKLDALQQAIAALQDLPKQHSLLLLEGSIHLLLRHLLWQLNPEGLSDLWGKADIYIREAVRSLVARSPADLEVKVKPLDPAKEDPYSTLKEAADKKRRKYRSLGAFFYPLTCLAGGLMDQETSQTYKQLQELLGPFAASQLDLTIGLALTKTRAISAASIARDLPRKTHT
ncbi:Epsin-1 [Fusarium oxysporum f. sp. albedinis]|nr:Epsin-1 [Fusarium oxysporum f. sp. albedinis]